MSDPVIRRVRRSIEEAVHRGGMRAGMPKVTLDAGDVTRLCLLAEQLLTTQSREANQDGRAPRAEVPGGWTFTRESADRIVIEAGGLGVYVARSNSERIAEIILYALAEELLGTAPVSG